MKCLECLRALVDLYSAISAELTEIEVCTPLGEKPKWSPWREDVAWRVVRNLSTARNCTERRDLKEYLKSLEEDIRGAMEGKDAERLSSAYLMAGYPSVRRMLMEDIAKACQRGEL